MGRNSRGICLEGLRKTTEYHSQRSGEPDRDTKPGRPEYNAGVSGIRFINPLALELDIEIVAHH